MRKNSCMSSALVMGCKGTGSGAAGIAASLASQLPGKSFSVEIIANELNHAGSHPEGIPEASFMIRSR